MTQEAKLQVERRVVEILGDLYGKYHQVKNLGEAETQLLLKHGIDINENSPVHKAAGILEDWPVGRGVFIQDSGDFFVLVNFEDHLKFVVVPSATNDFVDALSTITKSLITFE
jgi:hypothetical protein